MASLAVAGEINAVRVVNACWRIQANRRAQSKAVRRIDEIFAIAQRRYR
jgi:hypothetical protein